MSNNLSTYVKEMRRQFGLTQVDLAAKSGVGLRFLRELEQGKETLRLDKVNQVLMLFGQEVGPVPIKREEAWYGNYEDERTTKARHPTHET